MASYGKRSATSDIDTTSDDPLFAPPRRSKTGRRLLFVLLGLGILLAAVPQIVARTPLLGYIVGLAAQDVQGKVTVGEASLNWFTVPHADDIELSGNDGQLVARAACVHADRKLLDIAVRPLQLGRLRIERPFLNLIIRGDGTTNLDEVLANFTNAAKKATGTPTQGVDVALELIEGSIEVREELTNRKWQIARVSGVVIVPGGPTDPLSVDLQGSIAFADGPRPFRIRCNYRDLATDAGSAVPQGDAAIELEALPLDLAGALTRRFLPGVTFTGVAVGKLQTKFDYAASPATVSVDGNLGLRRPAIGGPLLQGDELRLDNVDLPIRASVVGKQLNIEQLGVACDLASAEARLVLNDYTKLFSTYSVAGLLDLLVHCDGKATARVSLAKIAQSMPHVLRLRDDVQVTGGDVVVGVQSRRDNAGARQWQADLDVASLVATARGQAVTWEKPLSAVVTAVDGPGGPVVDRVNCRADFLVVEGVNTPGQFTLEAQYSLDQLSARLDQFMDLVGLQLRGQGTADASWTREQDRFRVEGTAAVNGFELLCPGYPTWTERQLVVGIRATGRATGLSITSLDEATVGLESAGDQLTARLTAPVADLTNPQAVLPLVVEGRGQLATWLARLRPFAGIPAAVAADGQVELNAVGEVRLPSEVTIVQSKLTAKPLRLAVPGLAIDEPAGELTLVGRYHPERTEVRDATLSSVGTQAAIRNFVYIPGQGRAPELHGELGLRGDLAKLLVTPTSGTSATTTPLRYAGLVEASGKLERTGAVTAVALDAVVKDLVVQQGQAQLWREPQVRLVGSGVYEPRRDALAIDRLEVVADALRVLVSGKLDQISTTRVLDCRGEATYDLAKLTPLAQTSLDKSVTMTGRQTQPFQLSGPLVDLKRPDGIAWHQLQGAARLGWDQLSLYGFNVPKNQLEATLGQGYLRTTTIEVPVGGGKLRAAPTVRVGPEPVEVRLDPGVLADHVTITREMANERLMYVMPIMAGVAQVGGRFSIALEEFRVPISNPAAGAIAGKLTVHDVDVGPGFLTQELATLVNLPASVNLTRESVVDFKMIEGRIYHQNLEFAFPNVTVRTMGSVGVADQTLSLVAEVPIPSHLLQNLPIANSALSGQVIRVPIAGTLQKPTLDRDAFRQATAQFVQSAAAGALQQALGGKPNAVPDAVQQGQNMTQGFLNRGTTAAQSALDKSTNAAQNALNRGQDALNRGLNKLLGPGAAAPTTTEQR
ncbi:MAG: hypothetical protein J0M17_09575 [Planctomycetes bacterium]|nr:hypothetical protein [Planctomycetota bacterium]